MVSSASLDSFSLILLSLQQTPNTFSLNQIRLFGRGLHTPTNMNEAALTRTFSFHTACIVTTHLGQSTVRFPRGSSSFASSAFGGYPAINS